MSTIVLPLLVGAGLLVLGVMALSAVQRYRMGTRRRAARGWLAAFNVAGFTLSILLFFTGAAVTTWWVPGVFTSSLAGFAAGGVLGIAGLVLTRWEPTAAGLFYTPNRWLVLIVSTIVTARIAYGFWRTWHAWRTGPPDGSWLAVAGVAGTFAAGALVLGYFLVYWFGVWRRARRHRAVALPAMR